MSEDAIADMPPVKRGTIAAKLSFNGGLSLNSLAASSVASRLNFRITLLISMFKYSNFQKHL